MASRTPFIQNRSAHSSHWGLYDTFAELPNGTSGIIGVTNPFTLQAGDTAAVASAITDVFSGGLYYCLNPGTAGGGNALWVRYSDRSLSVTANAAVSADVNQVYVVPATNTTLTLSAGVNRTLSIKKNALNASTIAVTIIAGWTIEEAPGPLVLPNSGDPTTRRAWILAFDNAINNVSIIGAY